MKSRYRRHMPKCNHPAADHVYLNDYDPRFGLTRRLVCLRCAQPYRQAGRIRRSGRGQARAITLTHEVNHE